MKHSQGQKVKGHKIMRRSSTKTSNISSKRHSVVEMHLSRRKSRSPERMARSDFWPEVPKLLFLRMRGENMPKTSLRCFCTCALKKSSKHSENVFRQKSYSSVTGNGGRRSERRGQIFDWKLINRRFCACAVKNRPKTRLLCVKWPKF